MSTDPADIDATPMTVTTGLVTESAETLAEALGKHCPIYDYEAGQFLMVCGCEEWRLGGVDRAEAERRFGEHIAAALIASGAVRPAAEVRAETVAPILALADEWDRRADLADLRAVGSVVRRGLAPGADADRLSAPDYARRVVYECVAADLRAALAGEGGGRG